MRNILFNGGCALALVILTSIGWLNYLNITRMNDAARLEHHSTVVIREFDLLLSALKDVETGESVLRRKEPASQEKYAMKILLTDPETAASPGVLQ